LKKCKMWLILKENVFVGINHASRGHVSATPDMTTLRHARRARLTGCE
jgi:hypothetical protein